MWGVVTDSSIGCTAAAGWDVQLLTGGWWDLRDRWSTGVASSVATVLVQF
jgi:hypothetical protein